MKKVNINGGKGVGLKNSMWKGGISKDKKKYHQEYVKKNYEKVLWLNHLWRIRKINADGSHTYEEWELLKIQYNYTCPCCKRKQPEIRLTQDHIIPLSKGGSDNIENIQPLCRNCNSRKKQRIIDKYAIV